MDATANPHAAAETAFEILRISLVCLMVIVPIGFAGVKRAREAMLAMTAIFFALVFSNLDKLARFKGGGMELQMREARQVTQQANAAIGQLRELAVSLTAPVVDLMTISGDLFHYIPLKYKLQRLDKIKQTLMELGVPKGEVESALSTMYEALTERFVHTALYHLSEINPDQAELFDGLGDWDLEGWNDTTLRNLIRDQRLKTDEKTKSQLEDLGFWIKHRQLRRPDIEPGH